MERSESGGGLRPEESVAEMSWIRSTTSPKLLYEELARADGSWCRRPEDRSVHPSVSSLSLTYRETK
jgi:hypothetical protein